MSTNSIIDQLLDVLRNSSIGSHEQQLEFALLVLAWAKLSAEHKLPRKNLLTEAQLRDPQASLVALQSLVASGPTFTDVTIPQISRIDERWLLPLLHVAQRLIATGALQNWDPADSVLALPSSYGEWQIPSEVAELMIDIARIRQGATCYLPWDAGAQLTVRAARKGALTYLESPRRSAIPMLVNLLADCSADIRFSDPIRAPSHVENGSPRKFDVAVAFPPFNTRYDREIVERDWLGRFPGGATSASIVHVQHLMAHSTERVVLATPNSLLFSVGAERRLREELASAGKVEAVVSMPQSLLSHTTIGFSIVVLRPLGNCSNVVFTEASGHALKTSGRKQIRLRNVEELAAQVLNPRDAQNCRTVSQAEVLANEAQLQVERYLRLPEAAAVDELLVRSSVRRLDELAAIIRPAPVVGTGEAIAVEEVGAADLPQFGYINRPSRESRIDRRWADRTDSPLLKPFDIVLVIKGSVGKVGMISQDGPNGSKPWVAGQSAVILRVKGQALDPCALMLQLRSEIGQELMRRLVSGTSVPQIQTKALASMQVIVPSREDAASARGVLEAEERIQKQIDELRIQQSNVVADCTVTWNIRGR